MSEEASIAFQDYISRRRQLPFFANARSIRNAIDRIRLRHANRVFKTSKGPINSDVLSIIDEVDVRKSRVFSGGIDS